MKILFYNTNTNQFDPNIVHIKTLPSWASEWQKVAAKFPEHEFFIAAMLPAMFLLDYDGEAIQKAANINYVFLKGGGAEKIALQIAALKPDVAVAASFWITPYDWLCVQDAMVTEILRREGVRTICHPLKTAALCFDKYKTHIFLEQNNFSCAKAVHIQYDLFWAERKKSEVRDNAYRDFVFNEISKLNFPLIIKDTTGVSSYGMEVARTIGQVRAYFNSKKFNSDRLVEEFLEGLQFGTEVHTVKNADGTFTPTVFPPLLYSVNQYGITSPKQSVKLGPLELPQFRTENLVCELERLSRLLCFEGIAQIDLVFCKNEWHIIEINPRLSGSSAAIALIKQKSLPLILTEMALGIYDGRGVDESMQIAGKPPLYLNIKFPNLNGEQMRALYDLPFVKYLCQTANDAAKQRREMGFCEILFGGVSSPQELLLQLEEIKMCFPEVIEISFYETAKAMVKYLAE